MPIFAYTAADAFAIPAYTGTTQGLPVLSNYWASFEPIPATSEQDQLQFGYVFTLHGTDAHGGRIGSKTPLYSEVRTGSMGDHMVAANFHADWAPGHPLSIVMPLALDINNNCRDVGWDEWPPIMGLNIVSGGMFHPRSAIRIGAEFSRANQWRVGIEIEGDAYDTIGLRIGDVFVSRPAAISLRAHRGGDGIVVYAAADDDDTGAMIRFLNASGTKEHLVLFPTGVLSYGNVALANVDMLKKLDDRVVVLENE